jgi:hypothetical protein
MPDYNGNESPAPWQEHKASITGVIISDGVTSVGDEAFAGYGSLRSVNFGSSLQTIGERAFKSCNLTGALVIPDLIETIGEEAFSHCEKITGLQLGASVKTITDYVFYSCSSLAEITSLNPVPPVVAAQTFNGVNMATCKLRTPAGSVDAYRAADVWKNFVNIEEN